MMNLFPERFIIIWNIPILTTKTQRLRSFFKIEENRTFTYSRNYSNEDAVK